MKSFLQLSKETEKKLDRQLEKKELVFLQWVYERYKREQEIEKLNA
ncbi:hypothetical protein ACFQ3N_00495 [Virgibacillus byunsanensis]|uniref:Fur-regulated basic protein FbpA n=1 Tax=Virgibacillus byunsanensis TaxID=570945 RepID=A0ABW3LGT7_9BACI